MTEKHESLGEELSVHDLEAQEKAEHRSTCSGRMIQGIVVQEGDGHVRVYPNPDSMLFYYSAYSDGRRHLIPSEGAT